MKKLAVLLLIFAVGTTGSIAALASAFSLPEKNMPDFTGSVPVSTQEKTVNGPSETDTAYTIITPIETAANTETVQDEIYYKMLNSVDYFSTAKVSFSALFPGFETVQDYTIETDLNTGVAHQTCSDYFLKTDKDISAVYETYSDGRTIREYDNAAYTSRFVSAAEERHSLAEEWGDSERYYIDENNESHYRYRSNPTNADMAGECLFPQVSAFAYLADKSLWDVSGVVTYCGRECYAVAGLVRESYAEQIGAETFTMYVDKETGILLMLEACDATGKVVSSMVVSEIAIDIPVTQKYDMSRYSGYTAYITFHR